MPKRDKVITLFKNNELEKNLSQPICCRVVSVTPGRYCANVSLSRGKERSSLFLERSRNLQLPTRGSIITVIKSGDGTHRWRQALNPEYYVGDLLPYFWGINESLLDRLQRLLKSIATPSYRLFLNHLFQDHQTFYDFLTTKASFKNHHSGSHGLLRHSLEVAEDIQRRIVDSTEPVFVKEAVVLAGLLHDFGKVITHSTRKRMTILAARDHEAEGLRQLLPVVDLIKEDWECYDHLSYFIMAGMKATNNEAHYFVELLASADRLSAKTDRYHEAFEGRPESWQCMYIKNPDQSVWRPTVKMRRMGTSVSGG